MQPAASSGAAAHRRAVAVCAALVGLSAVLSMSAVLTKSATVDEPLHALAAFCHLHYRDFRINPEDPPLWKYLAAQPHRRGDLAIELDSPLWSRPLVHTEAQTLFVLETIGMSHVNDGVLFVEKSRWMMLPVAMTLGATIAILAWRLAGPLAAVVATALFSLDPNFLAHGPLVKNDVAISLLLFALAGVLWSVGQRISPWNLAVVALLCGVALATKFSGILAVPIVLLTMLARAMLPRPWPIATRELRSRAARLMAAGTICLIVAGTSWLVIWASYCFRFDPTAVPGVRLNLPEQITAAARNASYVRHGHFPSAAELVVAPVPLPVRLAAWAERHRLLPHAYIYGFTYTYQASLVRNGFLLGEYRDTGWWYYFPLAMLFKTPLVTLVALAAAGVVAALLWIRRTTALPDGWGALCLGIPFALYALSAMSSNLNLGIRHILPLYPFLFVFVGAVATRVAALRPTLARICGIVLALALAVETLIAHPNYIPFFNAPFRASRLHLLSDSNLDWGQDLPLLARWQERNPLTRLYFGYFGGLAPQIYGIEFIRIPGGYPPGGPVEWPESRGVIAISATMLQGTHLPPSLREYYRPLRDAAPRQILGGSIYLYDVPHPPLPRPTLEAVEREMRLKLR